MMKVPQQINIYPNPIIWHQVIHTFIHRLGPDYVAPESLSTDRMNNYELQNLGEAWPKIMVAKLNSLHLTNSDLRDM